MGNPFDFATQNDPGMAQAQMPPPQPGPPANPQDLQQRMSGWDQFLTALQKPGIAEALIQGGAQMMMPGTEAQRLGRGVSTFGTTATNLQQQATENKQRQTSIDEGTKRTNIYEKQVNAQIGAMGQESQVRQLELEKAMLELRQAQDPKMKKLALDKVEAEIAKFKAEANRANAEAKNPNSASVPGDVQLFDQEVSALVSQNPGMTRDQAVLRVKDSMRQSKTDTPNSFFMDTWKNLLAEWNSNPTNMTRQPPNFQEMAKAATDARYGTEWDKSRSAATPPPAASPAQSPFSGNYSSPIAAANASGTQAPQTPTGKETPLPKHIEQYKAAVARGLTPAQKVEIDKQWLARFNTAPPQ